MAVEIKHKFQSMKPDGGDGSVIRPSNWNDVHNLTMDGDKLLGRYSAGNGAAQEISIGSGLEFSGSELKTNVTKGDVGLGNVDNTSDADKPVSTAQATAIGAKVTKANDTGLGGFAVSGKSLGNLSGSITPTHADGNYQAGTITGALTINAPTAPGVYDLKIELLIGAGAGAVTLAGFSNTDFGEAFTTASGDYFILQIEKGATQTIATVRKPT